MQRSKESEEALRGLYISEGEVDHLLNRPAGMTANTALGHDLPEEFTQVETATMTTLFRPAPRPALPEELGPKRDSSTSTKPASL